MPTNTSVNSSLVFSGQVPDDLNCQINTLAEIAQGIVAVLSIQNTTPDGNPSPPDDSVAQLALSTANAALALAQSVQSSQKQQRAGSPQAIPTGDSQVTFPFSSPMPDLNYSIFVTLYAGASAHPTQYYGWRVLESSITTGAFTALFDNIPANSKAAFFVIQN